MDRLKKFIKENANEITATGIALAGIALTIAIPFAYQAGSDSTKVAFVDTRNDSEGVIDHIFVTLTNGQQSCWNPPEAA